MLNFTGALKVYVATEAADMRQSFSGLYGMTVNVMKEDPRAGGLFVFTNRRHTRVKVLYWDGTARHRGQRQNTTGSIPLSWRTGEANIVSTG